MLFIYNFPNWVQRYCKPRENASLLAIFRGAAYLKATKPIKDSANREENKINPFIFYPEVPRIFSNLAKDSATDA